MENNQNQAQLGQNQAPMGQNVIPNQAQVPQSVPTESAQSITQQPAPQMPQSAVPPKKNHIVKILLIMVILAILVILSILVYFSFVNNQSENTPSIKIENTTSIPTSVSVSPTPATTEEEVNAVDVGNVDVDLKDVDADLQQL